MARFPTYERRQGLGGGTTASYASAGAFAAPGEALQDLGGAIASAGNAWADKLEKVKNSQDDTWFSRARAETAMELQRFDEEQKLAATEDAAGYQEAVKSRFAEVRQRHLGEAPSPRAQQMYDEWSFTYSARVDETTGTFRAASELAKRNDDFASAMLAHTQTVFSDPSTFEDVRKRVNDDLEGAKQWMTPEQEFEVRSKIDRELELAKAKGDIIRDPKAFLDKTGLLVKPGHVNISFSPEVDAAIETAAARNGVSADAMKVIAQIESRGNPNAKNPNSSAGGLFQFIDGTAKQYGLANRYDPAAASDAAARLMRDNADTLRGALGREPTIGELYLAHQQGAGGAVKLLSNPGARALDIVGEKTIKLNGGHPDMTAQAFANLWISKAEKIAGKGAGPNPNFNHPDFRHLSTDDLITLGEEAQRRVSAAEREAQAQAEVSLAQVKGAFSLGIATGDPAVTQGAILASPLKDADKASLINSLNEKRKDEILASEYLGKIASGGGMDPYDTKNRKGVGLAYDSMTRGAGIDDETARSVAGYVYGQSGIVPGKVSNAIRQGVFSGDPERAAMAGSLAADLSRIRGDAALAEQEGGEDLAEAAQAYRHATETLGMSPEDAGQYLVDMHDPEKLAQRKAFMESDFAKSAVEGIDVADIRAMFDPSILGWRFNPDFPSEKGSAIAVAEYREIYKQSLFETSDTELAEQRAQMRFRRMYGLAETPSGSFIIKNAPSAVLPADDRGSHDWTRAQLMRELEADGIMAKDAHLIPNAETDIARREGQQHIPFDAWYLDENGAWQLFPGVFVPDRETRNESIEAELREGVDAAAREREYRKQDKVIGAEREKAVQEIMQDDTRQDWIKAREVEMQFGRERLEQERIRREGEAAVEKPVKREAPKSDMTGVVMVPVEGGEEGGNLRRPKDEAQARLNFRNNIIKLGETFSIGGKLYRFEREFEGADPLNVSP